MYKKGAVSILIFMICVACQKQKIIVVSHSPESAVFTKSVYEDGDEEADDVVITDWKAAAGIEERIRICDVPIAELDSMKTEDVLIKISEYPLNYIIFAYNNPFDAISLLLSKSNLHKEFVSREDAAEKLTTLFSNSCMRDFSIDNSSDSIYGLPYADEIFLEYFIASEAVVSLCQGANRELIMDVAGEKLNQRINNPAFSAVSIQPLLEISERFGCSNISSSNISRGDAILYTYFGHYIDAAVQSEMTAQEIAYVDSIYVANYPNAIFRSSSSRKYNCHSYAWFSDNVSSNIYWINSYDDGVQQLTRYWTDDLYVSCIQTASERVFYSDGDHSARVLSNGNYLSKWGMAPLMEHAPDNCPYLATNKMYFKERTQLPANILTVSGDDVVMPSQPHTYYYSSLSYSAASCSWDITYMNDSSATGTFSFTYYPTNNYGYLTTNTYGAFKVRINAYFNGNNVAYGEKTVVSVGAN